jgi:transcriptional regulator with XRE-family HTH domain
MNARTMNKTALNSIDKAFGERIKLRRTKLRMSQTDLASKCGISFQQIQKYENGANRVSVSRLFQLSDALGTTPAKMVKTLKGQIQQEGAEL